MGLEGIGIPSDDSKNEGSGDEDHEVAYVDQHGADESHIANEQELLGKADVDGIPCGGLVGTGGLVQSGIRFGFTHIDVGGFDEAYSF